MPGCRAERFAIESDRRPRPPRVALVTGTLAEPALRRVAAELAQAGLAEPTIVVLHIQVAALMTVEWVGRKLDLPRLPSEQRLERVILPGHCRGELAPLAARLGVGVERGPADLHDLPEHFGQQRRGPRDLSAHSIEIIAEINDAPRLGLEQIAAMAEAYRRDGADVIDLGCDAQAERPAWGGVAEAVRELRGRGCRVSIDSFHPAEVAAAAAAGAELVLSVHSANRDAAADWGIEVVAIPDTPADLASLDATVAHLERRGVRYRLDPVIEPIGLGFAASLGRYLDTRRRYPAAAMMMGVGNLSEMTEVDSAGVNALLVGFCQELGIGSVLTTQVINYARSSVREIDLARRIVYYAVSRRTVPKHLDPRLVMLRDPKLRSVSGEELAALAGRLTDRNLRLFADPARGLLHAMNKDFHLTADDPFVLFDRLAEAYRAAAGEGIDASHAFYLGYELSKAVTALTLHKNYTQDQALAWGLLTRAEISHHERRRHARLAEKRGEGAPPPGPAAEDSP